MARWCNDVVMQVHLHLTNDQTMETYHDIALQAIQEGNSIEDTLNLALLNAREKHAEVIAVRSSHRSGV